MSERGHAVKKSWPELIEVPPARPVRQAAVDLNGIIRAAQTANLVIDTDLDPVVADLVRSSVDGLLEAAEILSKGLVNDLDTDLKGSGK